MNERLFTNSTDWANQVIDSFQERAKFGSIVITDIDDTILDSSLRWYQEYVARLKITSPELKVKDTPSVDVFRNKGPRYFFSLVVDDYDGLKRDLMYDAEFNSNLVGVVGVEVLRKVSEQFVLPNGYITTRPYSLAKITMDNIQSLSLPNTPILFRHETVSYDDTIQFKIGALQVLGNEILRRRLPKITIYYIDDYASLIKELNAVQLPNIVGIVFEAGNLWEDILINTGSIRSDIGIAML